MRLLCATSLAFLLSVLGAQAHMAAPRLHCGANNPVVWVNTDTHVYHFKDSRYYGNTEHGVYMCKRSAIGAHNHMAKGTQP